MKTIAAAAVLLLLAGAAHAGGVDIKIVKETIAVSPIDAQGFVVVQGAPGTVIGGLAPVRVMAQSKKTKQSAAGMASGCWRSAPTSGWSPPTARSRCGSPRC